MSLPDIDFTSVMGLMSAITNEVDIKKFTSASYGEITMHYKLVQNEAENKSTLKMSIDISPLDPELEARLIEFFKIINILLKQAKNPPDVRFFKVSDKK